MAYQYSSTPDPYYPSSQDRRYPNAATPSGGSYPPAQPYAPPNTAVHNSQYAMYPPAHPSMHHPPSSRSHPNGGYQSYNSHYDNQRSPSYSSTSSGSSFAASPPTSPVYPASPKRPYQCEQCPLSFDRSHDLKRHIDSHSGARNFICTSCNKAFTRKDALKRHQSQKQCGTEAA